MKTCSVCGASELETRVIINNGSYLCQKHYLQIYRHGSIGRTIYDKNVIETFKDYAEIEMYDRYGIIAGSTKIDIEDVEKCSQHKWYIKKSINTSYAITKIDEKTNMFLHRFIVGYDGDMDVDHINRDGLDNRKSNLRVVTHSTNAANNAHAGVKQVASGRWQACIGYNYKTLYIGTYDTCEEALTAREAKRRELRD